MRLRPRYLTCLFSRQLPPPRWKHTAVLTDPSTIVVFGGFNSTNTRLNDVWIFNTVNSDWYQPVKQQPCFTPRGHHAQNNDWANLP